MQRREFLATSVVLAGSPLTGCSSTDPGAEAIPFEETLFPQSVAAGDPKPDSLVFWTRVGGSDEKAKRSLLLEVATDPDFEQRIQLGASPQLELLAERRWDYCIRVRVDGLDPLTQYYYRFLTKRSGQTFQSRTGQALTAPKAASGADVRFLVMSCQDYGGRYYLAMQRAVELEADFVLHLGDYVYETSGDPDFQDTESTRQIRFTDRASALALPLGNDAGETTGRKFLAARSLDNYRDLYRTVRGDRELQRLHERFAMIAVWDDHEFSDDSWGQNATYSAGQSKELDPERRANADQAWFEYMPVDYRAGVAFEYDREAPFPDNLQIYRDFRFGKQLHVLLTDLRRFRPDHVIAEDAHPARIAVRAERIAELDVTVPPSAEPYLDLDADEYAELKDVVRNAVSQGFRPEPELLQSDELAGPLSVQGLNALIESYNSWTTAEPLAPFDVGAPELQRGISYASVGKLSRYTSFGSRYFVEPAAFGIVALDRYLASNGASEQVMGQIQEHWFIETLNESECRWKVWGNPYTLSAREVDLSSLVLPDPRLARRFSLSADDWSGFPNNRNALLDALSNVQGLVALTGDSHSFFASGLGLTNGKSVVEFVCGAVSSTTYRAALETGGDMAGVAALAPIAGALIQSGNPGVAFQNVEDNGFALVVAGSAALQVTFYQVPHARLAKPFVESAAEPDGLALLFEEITFRVRSGSSVIERKTDDGFERWDPEAQRWI